VIKESFSRKCFNVFNVILMLAIVVLMVFPYLHVLAKALNDGADTARGGITIFPRVFTLENFKTVIEDSAFPRAFMVSVSRVILGTIISVMIQFMAAYAFMKKDLVGRGILKVILLIPMYFGGGLIPTYIFYANTKLLNNYLLYVLPMAFSIYNMTIIQSYLESIPSSLAEAAKLDGAGEFAVFWRIIVPLAKPIMATVSLWSVVGLWSEWTTTMYFFTKKKMFTLQYILVQLLKETERIQAMLREAMMRGDDLSQIQFNVTPDAIQCAQIIVTTIPIIIVYPFLQKYFIQGTTVGAVKD